MPPPRVREKIIKNTDGLSACRKADVDCILMANIFGEVLHFTSSPVPQGGKKTHSKEDNEKQKKSLSKNMKRPNSH